VVGVSLLNGEVAGFVLSSGGDHLGEGASSLHVVDVVAVHNDVLTEVSLSVEAVSVGRRGLVDGPVVHRRVLNWVLGLLLELEEVVVNAVNDDVSHSEVLSALKTVLMRRRRLVRGPVVHGRVLNGVGGLSETNGDRGRLVSDEVLECSTGDVVVEEGRQVVSVRSLGLEHCLGKRSGDGRRLVSHKVLEGSSGHVVIEKSAEVISIRSLSESNSDGGRLVSDKVLKSSTGDVVIEESAEVIGIGSLGKSHSDGGRLVGHKVLQGASGHVVIKEGTEVVGVRSLGKANGDRAGLVSDEVLEGTSGNVVVEEGAQVVGIRSLGKTNGDGAGLVGHEVLQGTSGNVVIEEGAEVVGIGSLGESHGDGRRLVGHEVLESSTSHVVVEQGAEVISVGSLGKTNGDRARLISNQVLEGSSGDIVVEEGAQVVSVRSLGKSHGNGAGLISDEVLEGSACNVVIEEGAEVIGIGSLSKANSDGAGLVGHKVLEGTSGDVMVEEGAQVISVGSLGKANSDGGRLISDQVLEGSTGDIVVEQGAEVVSVRSGGLGKSNGDRAGLVSHEVLQGASGDVVIEEGAEVVGIRSASLGKGNWGGLVGKEVLEGVLGDVMSVHLSNNLSNRGSLEVVDLLLHVNIVIVVREALIEHIAEGLLAVLAELVEVVDLDLLGSSLDHHGDGDVVVLGRVLLLISVLLEDGVEGVVADHLSEGLEGHRLDIIESVGGRHLDSDGLNLINGHLSDLGSSIEVVSSSGLGVGEVAGSGSLGEVLSSGVHLEESLNGVMKLLVEGRLSFLLILVEGLQGSAGLEVGGELGVHLSEVLVDVLVTVLESLLSELGHLALHHALLISEQAVRSSEEAFEGNNLLEEAELGVGLGLGGLLLLGLDSLLNGRVDLSIDLGGGEGSEVCHGARRLSVQCRLDERRDFLNMSLSIDGRSVNASLLLDSEHQTDGNEVLGEFET